MAHDKHYNYTQYQQQDFAENKTQPGDSDEAAAPPAFKKPRTGSEKLVGLKYTNPEAWRLLKAQRRAQKEATTPAPEAEIPLKRAHQPATVETHAMETLEAHIELLETQQTRLKRLIEEQNAPAPQPIDPQEKERLAAEKKAPKIAELQKEIERLTTEYSTLKTALFNKENSAQRTQLSKVQQELNTTKKTLLKLQDPKAAKAAEEAEQKANKITALKETVQTLTTQCTTLETSLARQEDRIKRGQLGRKRQELNIAKRTLLKLEDPEAAKALDRAELTEKIARAQQELQEAEQKQIPTTHKERTLHDLEAQLRKFDRDDKPRSTQPKFTAAERLAKAKAEAEAEAAAAPKSPKKRSGNLPKSKSTPPEDHTKELQIVTEALEAARAEKSLMLAQIAAQQQAEAEAEAEAEAKAAAEAAAQALKAAATNQETSDQPSEDPAKNLRQTPEPTSNKPAPETQTQQSNHTTDEINQAKEAALALEMENRQPWVDHVLQSREQADADRLKDETNAMQRFMELAKGKSRKPRSSGKSNSL